MKKASDNMIRFGCENNYDAPFIRKIEENGFNEIKFIVSLSNRGKKKTVSDVENDQLGDILSNAIPVYPDNNETYEIIFENYILYQTRNESYCSWDNYEIQKGKSFIIFEKSRLLDVLPQLTDCQKLKDGTYYPGKWKHYGIYCQNHIVDIISCNEPTIKKIICNEY